MQIKKINKFKSRISSIFEFKVFIGISPELLTCTPLNFSLIFFLRLCKISIKSWSIRIRRGWNFSLHSNGSLIADGISADSFFSDPEHQRANGNQKYFEFQLEKQEKQDETAEKETQQQDREKRDTTQKKKKKQSQKSLSLIPERKKYEMLCRGEGVRMVKTPKGLRFQTTAQFLTPCFLISISDISQTEQAVLSLLRQQTQP